MTSTNTDHDVLSLPAPEILKQIEERQIQRANEIKARRKKELAACETEELEDGRQRHAAEVIQRNYRGYRERRALQGHGLDSSTRWMEALKETKYKNTMKPQAREGSSPEARSRWKKAGAIAQRVGSDATSDSESEEVENDAERARIRENKKRLKKEREQYSKTIGLEYYLEAVDHKHRYGSSLRKYHEVWKQSDTKENFFYWLDEGEGKKVDLEERPRTRLDRECVRYLSREERKQYLVHIDGEGRFYWSKNGARISTTTEYKDSVEGIVPATEQTPTWRQVTTGEAELPPPDKDDYSDNDSISGMSTGSHEDKSKYTNDELHQAKGLAKLKHLNVDAIKNNLMRKTTKKNTWIFVADTSFRMYIGIKQSGAFQHSSFLRGARVSAAGLIKVKDGQLRALSPLSGHYAPPVKNFREFVKSLKQEGADLSRCSISKSYAILLGLEGYIGAKNQTKKVKQGVKDLFDPDAKRDREEALRDKSKSAELERQVLAKEEDMKRNDSLGLKLMKKMSLGTDAPRSSTSTVGKAADTPREQSTGKQMMGTGKIREDEEEAARPDHAQTSAGAPIPATTAG